MVRLNADTCTRDDDPGARFYAQLQRFPGKLSRVLEWPSRKRDPNDVSETRSTSYIPKLVCIFSIKDVLFD